MRLLGVLIVVCKEVDKSHDRVILISKSGMSSIILIANLKSVDRRVTGLIKAPHLFTSSQVKVIFFSSQNTEQSATQIKIATKCP